MLSANIRRASPRSGLFFIELIINILMITLVNENGLKWIEIRIHILNTKTFLQLDLIGFNPNSIRFN